MQSCFFLSASICFLVGIPGGIVSFPFFCPDTIPEKNNAAIIKKLLFIILLLAGKPLRGSIPAEAKKCGDRREAATKISTTFNIDRIDIFSLLISLFLICRLQIPHYLKVRENSSVCNIVVCFLLLTLLNYCNTIF